ncbi:MAG: flavodoxin domain-containing protein [Opitutales bacterium]
MAAPLTILYGTETGNAEDLAERTFKRAQEEGFEASLSNVFDFAPEKLKETAKAIIIISTWGEGDPPDEATDFCDSINDDEITGLENLEYAVLSLGDSGYDDFCGCGRKLDESLKRNGGKQIVARVDCDVDFEDDFDSWSDKLFAALKA